MNLVQTTRRDKKLFYVKSPVISFSTQSRHYVVDRVFKVPPTGNTDKLLEGRSQWNGSEETVNVYDDTAFKEHIHGL